MFLFESKPKPIWSEHSPGGYARRDALAVLRDAAQRCGNEDVRTPDVLSALAFLRESATRRYVYGRFLRALDIEEAQSRQDAVQMAYEGIARNASAKPPAEKLRSGSLSTESEASQDS